MMTITSRCTGYGTALIAGIVVGLLALSLVASAHPSATFYPVKWRSGTFNNVVEDRNVQWRFARGFPRKARRTVKEAARTWSQREEMRFVFDRSRPDHRVLGNRCLAYQVNRIGWTSFGGDRDTNEGNGKEALGYLLPCWTPDKNGMWSFILKINRDYPWFVGTSRDVPVGRYDLWSTVVHELGHATGFQAGGPRINEGHWRESSRQCPARRARHTLCPSQLIGRTWARTLEDHDRHTYTNNYP